MNASPKFRLTPLAALLGLMALSGCATKEFVQQEVGAVDSRISSRIDSLQNLLNAASLRISSNDTKIKGAEDRLGMAEQGATQLGQRIDSNLDDLNKANARIDGLAGDMAVAGGRIADNAASISRAHARLDTTDELVRSGLTKLGATAAGLTKAEERIGTAETAITRADARIAGSEATLASIAGRLGGTESALGMAQTRLGEAENKLADLAKPQAPEVAVQTAAPVATQDVATAPATPPATAQVDEAKARLDRIAAEIASANQRIAANSTAIDGLGSRIGGMETDLADTKKRTATGEQALSATNARLENMVGKAGEATTGVAAQAETITAVGQRVDAAMAALNATNQRVDAGDQRLGETTEQVKQLATAMQTANTRMDKHESDAAAGSATLKQNLESLGGTVDAIGKRVDAGEKVQVATGERVGKLEESATQHAQRLGQSETQMTDAVATIKAHEERLLRNETADAAVSATAKEALDRAIAAGRLAEGKLVYETVVSEELSDFSLDRASLSETGKQSLKAFAEKLRTENQNVFIEIQGHTDTSGTPAGNMRLGRMRAEVVRDYLHKECGLPLHRLSVISYGETRPLADNKTRDGRVKNRRVELVVLK